MSDVVDPPVYYVDGAAAERRHQEERLHGARWLVIADYRVAMPAGSLRDYVDNVSFRGMQLDIRYRATRRFAFGVGFGWQLFNEKKERATYPIDNGAITATLYRSMELVPIVATFQYQPIELGPVKPYLGIGVGPSYTYFQTLAADLASTKSQWYFTLQPEAGTFIALDDGYRSYGINVSLRYTWLPATFGDVTNVQALGAQLGLYSQF